LKRQGYRHFQRVIELSCIEYIGNDRTGKVFSHLPNPEGKIHIKIFQVHKIPDESGIRIGRVKKTACENSGKGIFSNPGRYKLDGKTRKSSTWFYGDKKPGKRVKLANELRVKKITNPKGVV